MSASVPGERIAPRSGWAAFVRRLDPLLGPLLFLALLVIWHVSVQAFAIPSYILPTPFAVWRAFMGMLNSGLLVSNALSTLKIAFGAYMIAIVLALTIAFILSEFRLAERIIYPYFAALQSMPKVAIAPLVLIWFGFGPESKLVLGALLSFFPILVNAFEGLKAVDENRLRLLKSMNASRAQLFWLLKAPNALPYLLVGFELGAIYAMLGTIVGEFVGPGNGLGAYLMVLNSQMDAASTFAIVILLAIYGALMQRFFRLMRRRFVAWAQASHANEH